MRYFLIRLLLLIYNIFLFILCGSGHDHNIVKHKTVCDSEFELLNGEWNYMNTSNEISSYASCPILFKRFQVINNHDLESTNLNSKSYTNDNILKYELLIQNINKNRTYIDRNYSDWFPKEELQLYCNTPFKTAIYRTNNNCSVLSINESIKIIKKEYNKRISLKHSQNNNIEVYFIGDSLGRQSAVDLECLIEQDQIIGVSSNFIVDLALRNDIPCNDNQCFPVDKNPLCRACNANGTRKSIDSAHPFYWLPLVDLNKSNNILVLNSGAWYNRLVSREQEYNITLLQIAQWSKKISENNIIVWIALPPTKESIHGWELYRRKNEYARIILEPNGVIIIDTNDILQTRKLTDPSISKDGLHWCNPTQTGAVRFINTIMFHLIVSNIQNKRKQIKED